MPLQGPSGSRESLQGPTGTRARARPQWLECVTARPQLQKSRGKPTEAEAEQTGETRDFSDLSQRFCRKGAAALARQGTTAHAK